MNDWKAQLAPGWSGLNIGILIVLAVFAFPLALVMLAYIVWGDRLGLDLGRPETFAREGRRLGGAFGAGRDHWRGAGAPVRPTGRPDPVIDRGRDVAAESERLAAEREAIRREREELERERATTKH